jgi:bile acid:Na+ symporter, BASS family
LYGTTLKATAMTPLMTKTLAGTLVPVDAAGLFASTVQVVLMPVLSGLLLKKFAPAFVALASPFCPLVAVGTVALICASIIGQSSAAITAAGGTLLAAVACLHLAGFFLGYHVAGAFGFEERDRRTVSVEVGMQNSALGVVLATAHFADPLVAVPCAISATAHSCIGSAIAGAWRAFGSDGEKTKEKKKKKKRKKKKKKNSRRRRRASNALLRVL